jgi:hypothetical protein
MQRTSKSPRAVALEALEVGQRTLSQYAHRFSPQKFTQPQLFALLVLKAHQQQDYRGIVALLEDMPELVKELGLKAIPHYTTLQKAADRLLNSAQIQHLLDGTVERFRKKARARSISPRPTRRAWRPAAHRATLLNVAKAARKSKNS